MSMMDRIIGVFKLDVNTFEEIEADQTATGQAALIVAVVGIFTAISAFVGARAGNAALGQLTEQFGEMDLPMVPTMSPVGAALNALIGAFIAWFIWSGLTYLIGTKVFNGQADMGEMLRVIGFAQAPRLLGIFNFIPCLGWILGFVAWIWAIAAGFVAIRQGLDLDNVKTLLTIVASWVVAIMVNWLILGPIFALLSF